MSLRVLCPNGHELVAELEHVGRKIRCPACKVVMIVPDPNPQVSARPSKPAPRPAAPPSRPPAPEPRLTARPPKARPPVVDELDEVMDLPEPEPEPVDDEPRKSKGMKKGKRMALANLGLGFHYAKIICILVAILCLLCTFLAGMVQSLALIQVLTLLSGILILVTPLLGGTGSLLCFWLPAKSNSRVLVIVSFSLEVGGAALWGLAQIMAMSASGAGMGGVAVFGAAGIMLLLALLIIYASFIMFLIFLRFLAGYLRDSSTRDEAMRQLILYLIVTLGGFVGLGVVFAVARGIGGNGGLVLLGLAMLGWLVALCFSMFGILTVLGTIRSLIARRF